VKLTVANTGPPVPPDQVHRLLEPFQRATPERTANPNGLGLGLSIVAQIAEAHGANLDVRPGPEGGLTVTVNFPPGPTAQTQEGDPKWTSPAHGEVLRRPPVRLVDPASTEQPRGLTLS
jgi:K+-sensing histidine kinase KdpD